MLIQTSPFAGDIPHDGNKQVVRTAESFERMLRHLRSGKVLVVDYETSGLAWHAHAEAVGVAFATIDPDGQRVWCYYVPFRHVTGEYQLEFERVAPAIQGLLEDPSTLKVGQNIKFEDHFSRREGWRIKGERFDTMIASHLYDENLPLKLETRAQIHLGRHNARDFELRLAAEIARLAKEQRLGIQEYKSLCGYKHVPVDLCGIYACWDVDHTANLFLFFERYGVRRRFARIWSTEMCLTEALCEMEEEGLLVDVDYLEGLRAVLAESKERLEGKIQECLGGRTLALGSDLQLREFLSGDLKLPLQKLTKGKQYAVDREALEAFQEAAPVVGLILQWRDAEKLLNTYTSSILEKLDSKNRCHPNFQQVGTNTGRLSCREPNFQNMPTDDEERSKLATGKGLKEGGVDPWSIRRAFVVPTGAKGRKKVRLFFDYSQIELRVLAKYSADPRLVQVYLTGGDLHDVVAKEVGRDRRTAKAINFGLSYCLTHLGLARRVKLSEEEAKETMDRFAERFPGIPKLRNRLWAAMRRENPPAFTNLFGRCRRIEGMCSTSEFEAGRAERQAIGSLIQGTAAELTKESICRIWRYLADRNLPARLVNTVHDEIQIDVEVEAFAEVAHATKALMEDYPEFAPIPIIAEGDYSTQSWAQKQPIE